MPTKVKEKRRWGEQGEEYVKSAAWAWYLHRSKASSKFVKECDAHAIVIRREGSCAGPSRFKLEAMGLLKNKSLLKIKVERDHSFCDGLSGIFMDESDLMVGPHESSLLDPYEMEALCKQLHTTFVNGGGSPVEESMAHRLKSVQHQRKSLETHGKEKSVVSKEIICKNGSPRPPRARFSSHGNESSRSSKFPSHIQSKWMPIMCSLTDAVIPRPVNHAIRKANASKFRR